MRAINKQLRDSMAANPFYWRCCISGIRREEEKIDFHHNFIFAGKQINEAWCILPLARSIHDRIVEFKEICDWIACNRASWDELERYSKVVNYHKMKERLNSKYGIWSYQGIIKK